MAVTANVLTVTKRGSNVSIAGGLTIYQVVDAASITGIDFKVDGESLGLDFNSATDKICLVTADGHQVDLTRVGDYHRLTVDPDFLGACATKPGQTYSTTAQIVWQRDDGTGIFTRTPSASFSLNIVRQIGFNPEALGSLLADWDAYDLTSLAVSDPISAWDDRSSRDADLSGSSTTRPFYRTTSDGRPYAQFDGTDDKLETSLADFDASCTAMVVARLNTVDATVRGIIQVGGTNGPRIAFDNANLKGISGSDVANTTLPATGTWFIATVTKTESGNVTIRYNNDASVSQSSTAAVTAGIVGLGDTAADSVAHFDLRRAVVWNKVLSATETERAVRAMAALYGISV